MSKTVKLSGNNSQFRARDVLAFSLKHDSPDPPNPAPSSIRQQLPFILKSVQVTRITEGSSLLVNTSNAAVSEPKIQYILWSETPHPPLQPSHFKWEVKAAVPERASERGVGIPSWKFAERRELTAPHWAKRMGARKKWPLRGEMWMRWVGSSDGGEGVVSAGRSAGRRIEARSPSQERAAVNTRPQGGGSPRRARYLT